MKSKKAKLSSKKKKNKMKLGQCSRLKESLDYYIFDKPHKMDLQAIQEI